MITAAEAKSLYDQSGAEAEALLFTIEPHVINAANEGKRTCNVLVDSIEPYQVIKITPVHQQVVNKLKNLGYQVAVNRFGDPYVPPGLRDDNGDGPMFSNYGFMISW